MPLTSQREHAVYAFNLAIALDHLTQPRAAADYYRRALAVNSPPLDEPTRQQASDRLTQLNIASN